MRVPTCAGTGKQLRRSLPTWGAKQGQGYFAGHVLQAICGPSDLLTITGGRQHKILPRTRPGRWSNTERRGPRRSQIRAPIGVVPGVGCKFVPLCGPSVPPGSPVVAQAAIPFLGAFVGGEKRHAYLLACENVGDQRRHGHMASIEGQIERLFTVFLGTSAGYKNARSYKIYSKTNSQRLSPARRRRSHTIANQRGACCNVHTPWGDLPTVTCRTTFLASVSTTESLRAQRELT